MPARLDGDVHKLSQIVLTLLEDACAGPGPVALVLHLDFDADRDVLVMRLCPDAGASSSVPASGADEGVVALLRNLRLTMLAQLVSLMGGTLARRPDEILLTMPARVAPAETDSTQPSQGEPAHVLLVDDGATSGQLLTLLLTQKGHRVCRVGDGEGAQFACRDARHDLVVFDLPAGARARAAALAALRAFRGMQAGLPIIVLADGVSAEDEAVLRELRIATTLSKPFSPDALQDAIATCRVQASDPAPAQGPAIDAGVRSALVEALGEAAVTRLTGQLLAQIEALATASAFDADAVARLGRTRRLRRGARSGRARRTLREARGRRHPDGAGPIERDARRSMPFGRLTVR